MAQGDAGRRRGGLAWGRALPVLLVAGAGMPALSAAKGARRAAALEAAERTRVARRREGPVRAAGPGAMEFPPDRWDMVDEQADQSFPASDPPGNY